MKLSQLPMVVLLFIARTCRSEIITASPSSDESTSRLVEDVVKIVTSCYGDRIYGVGIGGSLPDTLSRTLSLRHLIPVALIDRPKKVNNGDGIIGNVPRQFQQTLPVFILKGSSRQELIDIASNIKRAIWIKPMAPFFILDQSPGCVNTEDFLSIAWRLKLLNAKVMCCHYKSERIIVGYNPFTSEAPLPWQHVGVFKYDDGDSIFLFGRKYGRHEAICVELDFDKTKVLRGYEIRVEGRPLGAHVRSPTDLATYQFWSINERILNTVYHAMNVTPKFTGLQRWDGYLYVDMRRLTQTMLNRKLPLYMTYPHHHTGLAIISQFRAQKSQPYRILPVIEIASRFVLGIVYFITLMFFKFCVRRPLVSAFLNLIRITCNMGFTNLPRTNTLRIYLSSLLLFAVAMQGIYQCHLTFLLTTRIPLRNVDTIADLAELGYKKIYGLHSTRHIVEDSGLKISYEGAYDIDDCIKAVTRNSTVACIWPAYPYLFSQAHAFGLHVSSEFVLPAYVAFEIVADWSLEQRMNVIIAKLVEGDLLRPWDVRCSPTRLVDFPLTDSQRNRFRKNKIFEKIDLGELTWAFVILSIGLACATVTLLAELAIRYKCRIVGRQITN